MNLGVAVGIAVASAVINNGLENCLIQTFEPDTVTSIMQSSTFIRSGALSPEQIDITAKCYNSSFRSMWFAATAFAGIGFISTLFIKQHSLLGQQPKEIDVNEEKMVQDTENQKIENEEIEYQIDEGDDTTIQKKE
jgi:hypothetical protein